MPAQTTNARCANQNDDVESQSGPERNLDAAVQGASDAEALGSVRTDGGPCRGGETELPELHFGTDDARMTCLTRRKNPATDDAVSASLGQDLTLVLPESVADERV